MMKKLLLSFVFFVSFMSISNSASAKGIPIFYSNGLKFATTQQLPDSAIVERKHVNLGVAFKQFSIFWIPMWNYGKTEYVLVTDDGKEAFSLDHETLNELKTYFNVDVDKEPRIPFWNRIGGKLIWGGLIALAAWGILSKKDKEEEGEPQEVHTED